MAVDLVAMAVALGATTQTRTVTEVVFSPGRKIFLEDLQELDERAAVQKLINLANLQAPGATR